MVHALIALLFPLALFASLGTIGWMLTTHGRKMMAALRMEHDPAQSSHAAYEPPIVYRSIRMGRTPAKHYGRHATSSLARAA